MLRKVIQQKEFTLENPIKSLTILDKTDPDNRMNSYVNNRIPMALKGNVSIKEIEFTIEYSDMLFNVENVEENSSTLLYEIKVDLAPNEEILNLYKSGRCFTGTVSKDATLYTKVNAFEITTPYATKLIETGKNETYYGHIYEYKKKDKLSGKSSNLGYEYCIYINPTLYKYQDVILMVKELFNIE